MSMKSKQYYRIEKNKRKYGDTNIAKDEIVSQGLRAEISRNYYSNQQRRTVDAILNNVRNKDVVKEDVHYLVKHFGIANLCHNCKEEVVIAILILYCFRSINNDYRVERTALWREYDLNWRTYSLVITNLLREIRANPKYY